MKLTQKRMPFITEEFTLTDGSVKVYTKRLLRMNRYEIPYKALTPTHSEVRSLPLFWAIFSAVSAVICLFFLYGAIWHSEGDSRLGLSVLVLMSFIVSLCGWIGFIERHVDMIIVPPCKPGYPALYIRRTIPSSEVAMEFISKLKERIEDASPPF